MPYAKERRFALAVAKNAGKIIQRDFKLGMKSWYKKDKTVVTNTDIKINKMVNRLVKRTFKGHSVLAEEGSDPALGNKVWVCDPLDGTLMFLHGVPTCVFSIAYVEDGKPMVGVVFDPFTNRLFWAVKGKGAFLNGKKINVSTKSDIKYSLMGVTCWKDRGAFANITDLYKKLINEDVNVVDLFSIAYTGVLVAAGQFEASVHPATASHDSAALKIIVEEAGGKVTDMFGEDQRYDRKLKGCIISNGLVHEELAKIVRASLYS